MRRCNPPAARAEVLAARGNSTPPLYELDARDAGLFRGQMLALKDSNPYHASVHVYDEDEYRGMRMLVTNDGKAGVALKGDEIVSVYAHSDGRHQKVALSLLATAVDQGGRRLDCYDTVLPRLYARAGFEPVARLGFDDDYAPEGWDYQVYDRYNGGRPDIVFMAYRPERIDSAYVPGEGRVVADYDEGTRACIERAAGGGR